MKPIGLALALLCTLPLSRAAERCPPDSTTTIVGVVISVLRTNGQPFGSIPLQLGKPLLVTMTVFAADADPITLQPALAVEGGRMLLTIDGVSADITPSYGVPRFGRAECASSPIVQVQVPYTPLRDGQITLRGDYTDGTTGVPGQMVSANGMRIISVSPSYYSSAEGKTGQELKAALHAIIQNHIVLSANDTPEALKVLDEDPANTSNVWLLYAQRSEPKTNYGGTQALGWEQEHMWPQSYGFTNSTTPQRDLHNLRAEDASVNRSRGNDLYDVSDTTSTNYLSPAHAEAPLCSRDGDSWQPPATVVGDIARAMFFMDTRYEGGIGEPDLILTDVMSEITSATNLMGRLTTLIKWHLADPVDDAERRRNDLIYDLYQQNRNPFVDRPEWVEAVFLPELAIEPEGEDHLRLSWPALYKDARVQFSLDGPQGPGSLGEGTVWATVQAPGSESGGTLSVFRPQSFPITFYRLILF